jgi:hypothetical protein
MIVGPLTTCMYAMPIVSKVSNSGDTVLVFVKVGFSERHVANNKICWCFFVENLVCYPMVNGVITFDNS